MRKRKLYMSTALILMLVLLGACGKSASVDTKDGIKIGVLFSLSGGTAITEKSMADAAMLAIEEINQNGGVNGKDLVPIQEDYVSDPAQAATKAKKLILEDNVAAIIGGLTSASRQAMLPIVEQNNSLLIYPGPYEGEEYSKNILYTGAVPNQQLQTFIPWLTENVGKKVYLIGNDYVYPVETNNQVKKLLELSGGEVVGEEYVAMGESEFSTVLNNIRKAKPDYVFSTLVAESVPAFYSQYADYGMNSTEMPIASPTTSETEVAAISSEAAKGNISSLAYFENIDTPENASFVKVFHEKYGEDQPITTSMESAYFSVYLLAQTLEKIDDPYNTDELLANLIGQEFLAPEGKVKVDENNHTWLYARIAKLDEQGEFEILQTSDTSIQPEPWSKLLFPDHEEPWKK